MLNADDLAAMQADLADLAGDAEQSITYRRYTGTSGGDAALGLPATDTYADETTTATVQPITAEVVQLSGGAYRLGDLEFGMRRTTAAPQDRIVYDGATWEPVEMRPVILGGVTLRWRMVCRKV